MKRVNHSRWFMLVQETSILVRGLRLVAELVQPYVALGALETPIP
jgi:hypothetical protein